MPETIPTIIFDRQSDESSPIRTDSSPIEVEISESESSVYDSVDEQSQRSFVYLMAEPTKEQSEDSFLLREVTPNFCRT